MRFLIAFLGLTSPSLSPAVGASAETLVLLLVGWAPIEVRMLSAVLRSDGADTSFAANWAA